MDPPMSRKILLIIIGGGIVVLLLVVLLGLYWALRYEPAFYRQAAEADPAVREKFSKAMLRRALAFEGDVQREGAWQATFTAEEINGWLSHDLPKNHPQMLPVEYSDPRVTIQPEAMQLACRYKSGVTSSVLCLSVEPSVPEPNILALKIIRARAGMLPLPLSDVLNGIRNAAQNAGCRLEWRQLDGNPVALITLSASNGRGDLAIKIKTVQLSEGKIFISGSTKRNQ